MRNFIQQAKSHRVLIENFGYLSALQAINTLLPLVTYPYLIRVLGPGTYGRVVFAQGIIAYCSVVINFGFSAGAPRDVAEQSSDRHKLSQTVSSIITAKSVLWLLTLIALCVIVEAIPPLARDRWLYMVTFSATVTPLLFPDWYFQGIEKMKYITVINFGVRLAVLAGIFAFINAPSDYLLLPAINGMGAVIGAVVAIGVVRSHGVRLYRAPWSQARGMMSRSAPLFLSSAVASLSDKGGAVVIGAVLGPVQLAYYDLAEKLTSLAATVYYNAGRTVYPKLAQSRDRRFSRKFFKLIVLAGVCGSIALGLLAPLVIPLFAGERMRAAIPVMQILSPYLLLAATGPALANVLLIEKKQRSLFLNSVFAATIYVGSLGALWASDMLTTSSVAFAFLAAGLARNSYRYYQVRRHGLSSWLHRPGE